MTDLNLGSLKVSLKKCYLKVSLNKKIVICQTRTWGHSISTLFKAGDGVNTLILSTDGNYCLNGGADGRVELRDAWTLDLLHTFPKCDTGIGLKFTFCSRAPPRMMTM